MTAEAAARHVRLARAAMRGAVQRDLGSSGAAIGAFLVGEDVGFEVGHGLAGLGQKDLEGVAGGEQDTAGRAVHGAGANLMPEA
jgi:hypothetical protein